jgi:uncharacterized protein YndB with AHSA1/START domain
MRLSSLDPRLIRVEREFAAPPEKLFRAHTETEWVKRWMAMPGMPLTDCRVDGRIGGGFRYVWEGEPAGVVAVTGRFLDLVAPHRIVHTEVFDEDWTDGETLVITSLLPGPLGTRMIMDILYSGPKGREMAAASGMEEGMAATYDALEAILAG